MLRGLLLGASWGGLIAATAVTSVSLVYSNANRAPITDGAQEQASLQKPDVDAGAAADPTDAPVAPVVDANEAPKVMIPAGDSTAGIASINEGDMPATPATDMPVTPSTTAGLPTAPNPEVAPEIDTQAAAMTAPEMQDAPASGDPESGDPALANVLPQTDTPDVQGTALPQINTPDQPQSSQQDAALAVPAPAELPAPKPAPKSTTEGLFDTTRVPAPKMTNLAPNVKTNRLPSIGGTAEAGGVEAGDVETGGVEAGQQANPEPYKGALVAHAMTFENPDAKPMFSVILIDDPKHPMSDDVLSHLPFALSFAVDAVRDDAHAVAARYRVAGFEVLMLTNLPFGANATDIEVAFGAYSRAIPEAVAVLDLGANGFLRGPSTATQIAGIMSEKGYGLITPSKGLNSAQKAAMREGVPAELVFRALDEGGENPSVIRRYLDRAAFRAAQEGSVIMLGHTRPDTIEALVAWALESRAASVAIAPVSAVLLSQ